MITKGKYKHYKGQFYELIDTARHSETLEHLAVYRALYGDYSLWVRPLDMFLGELEIGGQIVKRFKLINE